jgi:Bacteriophage Sf6, terminase small subunit-like
MTGAKSNPGKYPVPQHAIDWTIEQRKRAGKKGSGRLPQWWPTAELTRDLCALIAAGENIHSLDRKNPSLPPRQRVLAWVLHGREAEKHQDIKMVTHPDILNFCGQWSRACRLRLEASIEEMANIEARLLNTPQKIEDPQGRTDNRGKPIFIPNPAALDVQAARTVLESRRWRLSRELPERFGDRSKIEHSGSVKVERPADHMPEWMRAQLEAETAKVGTDAASETSPNPALQQGKKEPTVH